MHDGEMGKYNPELADDVKKYIKKENLLLCLMGFVVFLIVLIIILDKYLAK